MPNSHNLYNFSSIVDFVDDAIIAYASTPVAAGPCDFSCIQQVVGFGKALLGGRRFDRKQPAKGPLNLVRRHVQEEPHAPEPCSLRKSSSFRNLSGLLLISLSIFKSSASSSRSSIERYSSMSIITAAGLPPRSTISGLFLLLFAFITALLTEGILFYE